MMPPAEGDLTQAPRRSSTAASQDSDDTSFPSLDNVDATSTPSDGVTAAQNGSTLTLATSPKLSTPTPSPGASRPRASSVSDMASGAQSPQQLVRRLSLSAEAAVDAPLPSIPTPELPGFSGNVISVNFCIPYKVEYDIDVEDFVRSSSSTTIRAVLTKMQNLLPQKGTSALFDSFSYLSSTESEWSHKLIAWTGEIEEVWDPKIHDAPKEVSPFYAPYRPKEVHSLKLSAQARNDFTQQVKRKYGGHIQPVWLHDEITADDTHLFREQEKWRRYGEHELFGLFHYKRNDTSHPEVRKQAWRNYHRMNELFAQTIMEVYRPGDVVMIHDYQLLLLPAILRRLMPNMYIGFFLHIPFPSSEYFRTLPTRELLLHGMLGADTVGFQTKSYAAHFKYSCERILSLQASDQGVEYRGAYTAFEVFPIGLDARGILSHAFSVSVSTIIAGLEYDKVHTGRKVIMGRDRLDSARGIMQKIEAFGRFLDRHPEMVGKVVMVQITSPLGPGLSDLQRDSIDGITAKVNADYGHLGYLPVTHHAKPLRKDQYLALLRLADLAMATSLRDGMNTTALEYILCQRDRKNPVIISEFSGTADSLDKAFKVNPWNINDMADKIYQAVTMDEDTKAAHHKEHFDFATSNSVQAWTTKCITRLMANLISNERSQDTPGLDPNKLLHQYSIAQRRLFLFDYDGTLTPIVRDPAAALPSPRTIHTIQTLASNPRNAVWIISGRDQTFLAAQFGHLPALGLSAEHGAFLRAPHAAAWEDMTEQLDMTWQQKVTDVFAAVSATSRGSYIERKKIAVTWHYRRAEEPEEAKKLAKACRKQLEDTLARQYEIEVMAGKANLEVRPQCVNKGEIVKRVVLAYGDGKDKAPDFILCLGDDSTDEGQIPSPLPRLSPWQC